MYDNTRYALVEAHARKEEEDRHKAFSLDIIYADNL